MSASRRTPPGASARGLIAAGVASGDHAPLAACCLLQHVLFCSRLRRMYRRNGSARALQILDTREVRHRRRGGLPRCAGGGRLPRLRSGALANRALPPLLLSRDRCARAPLCAALGALTPGALAPGASTELRWRERMQGTDWLTGPALR